MVSVLTAKRGCLAGLSCSSSAQMRDLLHVSSTPLALEDCAGCAILLFNCACSALA